MRGRNLSDHSGDNQCDLCSDRQASAQVAGGGSGQACLTRFKRRDVAFDVEVACVESRESVRLSGAQYGSDAKAAVAQALINNGAFDPNKILRPRGSQV